MTTSNFIKKALENNKISLEAKGLYMFLVVSSHIDAFNFNHYHKESLEKIKELLEELYRFGLVQKSVHDADKGIYNYVPLTSK